MVLIFNMVKMIVNKKYITLVTTRTVYLVSSLRALFAKQSRYLWIAAPYKKHKARNDWVPSEWLLIVLVFFLVLPLSNVYAANEISFIDILKNLKLSSEAVFKLTTAISYALGFWFMIAALMDLKHYGQSGGAQGNSSMSGPLMKFFIGVALIYLPGTMSSVITTFWGEGSVMAYPDNKDGSNTLEIFKVTAITIVQLIGLISFINGFVVLAHSSDQGAQPGTVAKGIFRVFSGMLAINVVATIHVFEVTFGITIL